jgi:hypothetical protein
MSMVTECNISDYVDAEDLLTMRKYGASIFLPRGASVYLPQEGGSFTDMISSVSSFINNHKDAISTVGSVADSLTKVANVGINIAKGVQEVENLKALRAAKLVKKGQGFEERTPSAGVLESSLYPQYTKNDITGKKAHKSEKEKKLDALAKEIAKQDASQRGSGFQIIT